jgi:hypothetical protein
MMINNKEVDMELDSGSPVSIMPRKIFETHFQTNLETADMQLSTFTGESIDVCGYLPTVVHYEGQLYRNLKLYVVNGGNTTPHFWVVIG